MNISSQDDLSALNTMQSGGVILCPTDTIWGLSCNAFHQKAVERIFNIKNRPLDKPLILLVHNITQLKQYVQNIHPRIETLIHYHRRPISVIYKANNKLPQYLASNTGTIAIRLIKESRLQSIIKNLEYPIVSTSANVSGTKTPRTYNEIDNAIKEQVDFILRPDQPIKSHSVSSMLISYTEEGELIFLRK